MINILGKLFKRETPLECLRRLVDSSDSRSRDSDTLQGALADSVLCLRDEGKRNGWLNGGEFHAECVDLIIKYLCDDHTGVREKDRQRVLNDLESIREAALGGAFQGRFAYDELDRIQIDLVNWCRAHPKPIIRKADQEFW